MRAISMSESRLVAGGLGPAILAAVAAFVWVNREELRDIADKALETMGELDRQHDS